MFSAIGKFFTDEATFSRVASDALFFLGAVASTPEGQGLISGVISPHATYVPALLTLVTGLFSMRARQMQTPPSGS